MLKLNDKWKYGGVIYTVERNEETGSLYFKHPSKRAGEDDHISTEHISHGELIKEESA